MKSSHHKYILFLSGPTASGKTALSYLLSQHLPIEVVNADMGQFYTPLSVGTAKPDWRNADVPHHLFDILDEPKDINVCAYRVFFMQKIHAIWARQKIPVVVGGSLFYIKSLFFPPGQQISSIDPIYGDAKNLWEQLNAIDSERAKKIHPHDAYRLRRALAIWRATGKKPSTYEPRFEPFCCSRIIFIDLPKDELDVQINKRTEMMFLRDHFVEEVTALRNSSWEAFLKEKKLIGYEQVFSWLESGADKSKFPLLITLVQQKTRQYAKRQVTFWKKFRNLLASCDVHTQYCCTTQTVSAVNDVVARNIAELVVEDFNK